MYGFSNDEGVLGSDFYIMEKMEGVILIFKEAKKKKYWC
jgi:aminoglycoside phosphotransferase (APT) family kinase protein